MGHVVGYMGDGINDAPALHAAVDVAREAADFVLLERDLAVLHDGIVQGRRTFAKTLKYVFITTSTNLGNMFSMSGASLLLPLLPFLPKQILLTNFLTDFPALAIANDSVDQDLVDSPQRSNVKFIRNFMVTFGLVSSLFDNILTFAILLLVLRSTADKFRTAWFLESVFTELLIMLVIRTRKRFSRSWPGRYLLIGTVAVGAATPGFPTLLFVVYWGSSPFPSPSCLSRAALRWVTWSPPKWPSTYSMEGLRVEVMGLARQRLTVGH